MKKIFVMAIVLTQFGWGCLSPARLTVEDYLKAAPRIHLGTTKAEVVGILEPTQRRLDNAERLPAEMYLKNGVSVEILYFRSGWRPDGFTAGDDFTPYVFHDDRLMSVGWNAMSALELRSPARARMVDRANTTVVPPF